MFSNTKWILIGLGGIIVLFVALVWFVFATPSSTDLPPESQFGVGDNRTVTVTVPNQTGSETDTSLSPLGDTSQKVFKISDGPIAGVTLFLQDRPTTTVARYVMQDTGRVFDLTLDAPGTIPRPVSNTTIPGIMQAQFSATGGSALLQYLNTENTIKTVSLTFPVATTTASSSALQPVRLRFFPDNISSIALSPNGQRAAYLVRTSQGADGYTSNADGASPQALFSLPLSHTLLSWPAQGTLLAHTASAAGVPGMVFSISASSGAVTPLIYGEGITAIADREFARVVYQTAPASTRVATTYAHTVSTNRAFALSFDPIPEKCIWSTTDSNILYCATPNTYVPFNYLDLWHAGIASIADTIFTFNLSTARSEIIAAPGTENGGINSDILTMSISPDERYLVFIKKGDRSLWGVRLMR